MANVLDTQVNAKRAGALFEFTQGIAVDARLASAEIRVQKAWARALGLAKHLTHAETHQACQVLDEAMAEIQAGKFVWRTEDEDIHMNLERFVTERAGALGKKIHQGRSRNDLIATTLRLYVEELGTQVAAELRELAEALAERAEKDLGVLVPGLTHLQHGQPIRHGHALAAHGWAFSRDVERVTMATTRAKAAMPLGSAALGGTALELDLLGLAKELGFISPPLNSYDAVGDRDFMVEMIDAFAQAAVHLSRLAEDCVIWSSTAVGLVKLPTAWSTGSSIMPNKRNPDVPELTRGRAAHVMAAANEAHLLLKSVPTSYGSDLHELKGVLMRAGDELRACLGVLPPFIRGLEPDPKRAEELLARGHILATEIADALSAGGTPFREAYSQVAAMVEFAVKQGVQVHELNESDAARVAPSLPPGFLRALSAESAVEKRRAAGGTSLARARESIANLRRRLRA